IRPLPFGDSSRLAFIFATHKERGRERMGASYADFLDWRRDNSSFVDLAAFGRRSYNLSGVGEPLRVQGSAATASFFSIGELRATGGRLIQPGDDRPGAPRGVGLSHGFWTRHFGSDPSVMGRTLRLDGEPHLVVGVLTPEIEIGTMSEIDVWTALAPVADPNDREGRTLRVMGRLKPGIEVAQAAA